MIRRRLVLLVTLFPLAGSAITLEECIKASLDHNPSIEAALHRIDAASAAVTEARSAFFPTLSLSAGYTRTDNPPQAFFSALNQRVASLEEDFNQPDDIDNLRLSAAARIMLLDGGQRSLTRRIASLGMLSGEHRLAAARNQLAFEVTRAYYVLGQARQHEVLQQANLLRVAESLRVARERFQAGATLRTDVLMLEVQEAEAREETIRAANRIRLAVAALNTAIGTTLMDLSSSTNLTFPETLPALPAPAATAEASTRRPELLAMNLDAESARLNATRATREHFPRLSAFASLDWDSDVSSDFEQSYIAGAVLEWDIFTGFRRRGASARSEAQRLEAEAMLRDLENRLQFELEQARVEAADARQRIDVLERSTSSAEEAFRITRSRYEEGAADITELLAAQVSLTAVATRSLNAYFDYMIALANVKRASGNQPNLGDNHD